MGFFTEWKFHPEDDQNYIQEFLSDVETSEKSLASGDEAELQNAFVLLSEKPIDLFIDSISANWEGISYKITDVPNFSNFDAASIRLPEILYFYQDGLDREALGANLTISTKEGARIKYAEQQSRIAAWLSLAEVKLRPSNIKITNWGKYLFQFDKDTKAPVFRKLLLRNPYLQRFTKACITEPEIHYQSMVGDMPKSSMVRRRSNVKKLEEFILSDCNYSTCLQKIDWTVD